MSLCKRIHCAEKNIKKTKTKHKQQELKKEIYSPFICVIALQASSLV